MFKNPHGTHATGPVWDVSLELCLWEGKMSTAGNLACQDEAEQGLGWREECEHRKRKASLEGFLTQG